MIVFSCSGVTYQFGNKKQKKNKKNEKKLEISNPAIETLLYVVYITHSYIT
jgi:hypothetical protein